MEIDNRFYRLKIYREYLIILQDKRITGKHLKLVLNYALSKDHQVNPRGGKVVYKWQVAHLHFPLIIGSAIALPK